MASKSSWHSAWVFAGLLLAAGAAAAQTPEATLKPYSAAAASDAIAARLGDRFTGPGVLTVGQRGSRKQLVLPAGDWLLLAMGDYRTTGLVVDMGYVVLGKFIGNRLVTMLRFSFNRGSALAQPSGSPISVTWAQFPECLREDDDALLQSLTPPSAFRDDCLVVKFHAGPSVIGTIDGTTARDSLRELGARWGGPALMTYHFLAEKRYGMLALQRTDWLTPALGPLAGRAADWQPDTVRAEPQREAYAKAFLAWTQRYRVAMEAGFRAAHADTDLAAGKPPPAPSAGLATLGDFEPPPR